MTDNAGLYGFSENIVVRSHGRESPWYAEPHASHYKHHRRKQIRTLSAQAMKTTALMTQGTHKPPWCGSQRPVSVFEGNEFHVHNSLYDNGYLGQKTKAEGIHTKAKRGTHLLTLRSRLDPGSHQDESRTRSNSSSPTASSKASSKRSKGVDPVLLDTIRSYRRHLAQDPYMNHGRYQMTDIDPRALDGTLPPKKHRRGSPARGSGRTATAKGLVQVSSNDLQETNEAKLSVDIPTSNKKQIKVTSKKTATTRSRGDRRERTNLTAATSGENKETTLPSAAAPDDLQAKMANISIDGGGGGGRASPSSDSDADDDAEGPKLIQIPEGFKKKAKGRPSRNARWDRNLPFPNSDRAPRTAGKHFKSFPGDQRLWPKDRNWYRRGLLPINLWDDLHQTPVSGIWRHKKKALKNIRSKIEDEKYRNEDLADTRRQKLQALRLIKLQKHMDKTVSRVVLEEMSGQLRHTQPAETGPIARDPRQNMSMSRPLSPAARSDGFRGIQRLKSGEIDRELADNIYSEPALAIQEDATPSIKQPYDRYKIIEPRVDHLSPMSRSPKASKDKIKTWRTIKHNPKFNDWDHFNGITMKRLKQAVLPTKDKWAIEKIQARQHALALQEDDVIRRREESIKATRKKFYDRQLENFNKEVELNPFGTSRPPTARIESDDDRQRAMLASCSPRLSQLASPKERREYHPELPYDHLDMSGMVYKHADYQQKENPEYIEDRDRRIIEIARKANTYRTRPQTAIAALNPIRTIPPRRRDVMEAHALHADIEQFEASIEGRQITCRDY